MLNWKKPKIWVSILAMLVCAVAICACAADPVEPQTTEPEEPTIQEITQEAQPGQEVVPVPSEPEGPEITATEPTEAPAKLPDDAQILGHLPGNISLTPMLYEAILDHHRSQYSGENFCCASFVVLDNYLGTRMHPVTGEDLSTMDYFLWVLYQEYQFTEDGIVDMGGTHIPTNITLTANPDGSWSVLNYWEPRDGSYYVEDIKSIFPDEVAADALDSQKYIYGQMQDCYAQAVSYAQNNSIDLNTDQIISNLLDTICAPDADSGHHGSDHHQLSSSHQDCISAHPIEYRELLYYGHHTLDYCQRHLENMGLEGDGPAELGLRERIMEQLLADLSV